LIITVTLNTAIDRTLEIGNFQVGKVFQARLSRKIPSGKGINVARVVEILGHRVRALGFVGELEVGFYHESLQTDRIALDLIPVAGHTRMNTTIIDPVLKTETHIREPGFEITEEHLNHLERKLAKQISKEDIVVFSGSIPAGAPPCVYKDLILMCHEKRAKTLLDSSGEALRYGVEASPYMVKPNLQELESILNEKMNSDADLASGICQINRSGVRWVVVSMGAEGTMAGSSEGVWKAWVNLDHVVNTVGSGDALLAGLAVSLAEGRGLLEALQLGVACGAANAMVSGAGLCRRSDIEALHQRLKIRKIR